MAKKFAQGQYVPKNPGKYIGTKYPLYRSSWELSFMSFCDNHPSIMEWASEAIRIPYRNPLTGRQTIYVPDFLIVYADANGKKHAELIEIKPSTQTFMESAKGKQNKAQLAINYAKWEAAYKWSSRQGIKFRIITENDMYYQGKNNRNKK